MTYRIFELQIVSRHFALSVKMTEIPDKIARENYLHITCIERKLTFLKVLTNKICCIKIDIQKS